MRKRKSVLISEDVETTCAARACVNGCVGEHERSARGNESAYVGHKIGRYLDTVRELFKIWSAAAAAGNGNPIPPPARIHRRQRGISVRTRQPLNATDWCASDLDAIAIDVGCAIHPADDN